MKYVEGAVKVLIVLFFLAGVSVSGFADEGASENFPPLTKLGRGISNILTSPLEIPKNMGDANREKGFFAGMTWGILHGAADTVIRACVGVFEVVTFPFPIPEGYSPVLKDPEYFLKDFN